MNLIRQIAFSYLIGNGDQHAKNISLLQQGLGAPNRLSPAYDLVCTFVYGDQKMALQLDGKNTNWKRKSLIEFGKRFGLSGKLINTMLDRLLMAFSKNQEILLRTPAVEKKRKSVEAMFKQRLGHLR